jgi:hypothetical protein
VLAISFQYTHVTADYVAGGGNIGLVYHGEVNSSAFLATINGMNYYDAAHTWYQAPNNFPSNSSLTAIAGLGVDFWSAISAPTAGDGTGVLSVTYTSF